MEANDFFSAPIYRPMPELRPANLAPPRAGAGGGRIAKSLGRLVISANLAGAAFTIDTSIMQFGVAAASSPKSTMVERSTRAIRVTSPKLVSQRVVDRSPIQFRRSKVLKFPRTIANRRIVTPRLYSGDIDD